MVCLLQNLVVWQRPSLAQLGSLSAKPEVHNSSGPGGNMSAMFEACLVDFLSAACDVLGSQRWDLPPNFHTTTTITITTGVVRWWRHLLILVAGADIPTFYVWWWSSSTLALRQMTIFRILCHGWEAPLLLLQCLLSQQRVRLVYQETLRWIQIIQVQCAVLW